ncbi:MAG TPA: NAD(P)H-binding protein [Longimicrobium sp.]|nr:NAD(P)H-binding protein [Longimicrobium sp.]
MKVLVFGATGAAGGSVLRACLDAPIVTEARAIVRRPLERQHARLRTIIHGDFLDYGPVAEAFDGIDACLWCLGTSVRQVPGEAEYRKITYDYAMAAARMVRQRSPGAAFHFISGRGTRLDSRMMWSRVKAETERDLIALVDAVCWRPGFIDGEPSTSSPRLYQALAPAMRLLRGFRSLYISGDDMGRAMLQATIEKQRAHTVENPEFREIAERAQLGGMTLSPSHFR